jgi:hypothetical protein
VTHPFVLFMVDNGHAWKTNCDKVGLVLLFGSNLNFRACWLIIAFTDF